MRISARSRRRREAAGYAYTFDHSRNCSTVTVTPPQTTTRTDLNFFKFRCAVIHDRKRCSASRLHDYAVIGKESLACEYSGPIRDHDGYSKAIARHEGPSGRPHELPSLPQGGPSTPRARRRGPGGTLGSAHEGGRRRLGRRRRRARGPAAGRQSVRALRPPTQLHRPACRRNGNRPCACPPPSATSIKPDLI